MTPALNRSFAYTKRKVRFAPNVSHIRAGWLSYKQTLG
jgi:hypothetical protein